MLTPTPQELARGHQGSWISDGDVVALPEAKHKAGLTLHSGEEALLLLLPSDLELVPDLAEALATGDEPSEMVTRAWMFLWLAWPLDS